MKRKLAFLFLGLTITLAACGGKAGKTEPDTGSDVQTSISETTETSVSDDISEPVPSAEDKEPSMIQEENVYYYYSDNHSVCIKLDYDAYGATIIDGDLEIPVEIEMGSYGTYIEKVDIDSDGEGEYIISECEGTGSGFCIYGLVIVKKNGNDYSLTRYDSTYFSQILDERISFEYHEDYNDLSVYFDDPNSNTTLYLPEPDEETGKFESLFWGDILYVRFVDKKVWISAPAAISYSGRPVPDYEVELNVSAPVEILPDGTITVGKIRSYQPDSWSNPEINENEKEIYHCYFDVTHDGIDDMVVSSLVVPEDFDGEINDSTFNGTYGYVKVFEGYVDEETGEIRFSDKTSPLWSDDFATAHVGNKQIFATTVDHKSYLVETSLYINQGYCSYWYEVFFLSYTTGPVVYSIESGSFDFPMDDEAVDTTEFFNDIYKWINESSILLVATDIDLDPGLYYSSRKGVLNPDVYYSQRK